jgi:hypothetical protein
LAFEVHESQPESCIYSHELVSVLLANGGVCSHVALNRQVKSGDTTMIIKTKVRAGRAAVDPIDPPPPGGRCGG